MEVESIAVDREEARKRVEEFTARRRKKLTEMDHALYKGYKALAEGLLVIDVDKMIKAGEFFEDNFCPKLAIARADLKEIFYHHSTSYATQPPCFQGEFIAWDEWDSHYQEYKKAHQEAGVAQQSLLDYAKETGLMIELKEIREAERGQKAKWYKQRYKATVPEIPFHLRPNGDAANYFILWEVEKWETIYAPPRAPADPILLEKIAHPIYVVVAQWDLTELEKRLLEAFRR
jgi:hypothetical protein